MPLNPHMCLQQLGHLALGSSQRARQVVLGIDTLNTVSRVDVLDKGDLVASRGTLSGGNGGESEEIFPNLDIQISGCNQLQRGREKLTLNQRFPYLATTLSWLPIQFLYHLQIVAE